MIKDSLANCVQQRFRTDSTSNQTTLSQRPGRDHRTSTGQRWKRSSITDRGSCRRVTDEELGRDTAVSQVSQGDSAPSSV